VYNVADKVVFDLLVNSAANKTLEGMSKIIQSILSTSPIALENFLKMRVFRPKELIGKDERNYFETLATHMDREVRLMSSNLLLVVMG
jgi:hypothetical protein